MALTPRRTLITGQSLWRTSQGLSVPSRAWRERDSGIADVAIIGTGISGALTAFALLERGFSVTMLDRRHPLSGSTMASTALLQFELDVPLFELERRIGPRRAAAAYRRSLRAVHDLIDLVRVEGFSCALRPQASLYVAGESYGQRALKVEATRRDRLALPSEFIGRVRLREEFGIDRSAALLSNDGAARANPAQLTAALLRRCVEWGARIWREANVVSITEQRRGASHFVQLDIAEGGTLFANAVVCCTGYEVPQSVSRRSHRIRSTWAIAAQSTRSVPPWLNDTVLWEAADPYLYLRADDAGNIIGGGRDERSASRYADATSLRGKARLLTGDITSLVPALQFRVTHAWAGAFGESPTGLPIIDRVPGYRRVHVVGGFGGNGITHSMIASQVLAAHFAAEYGNGTRDPDATLFRVP